MVFWTPRFKIQAKTLFPREIKKKKINPHPTREANLVSATLLAGVFLSDPHPQLVINEHS